MNYLPFSGYWFFGAADATETASFYCSWGLLGVAPIVTSESAFSVFIPIFRRRRR